MEQQDNRIQSKLEQKLPTTGSSQPVSSSGGQTNDNSNPQQGTGAGGMMKAPVPQSNHFAVAQDFKIPPTKKDARKLFVGGLPSDVTDHEFRTFFEQFGPVLDSVVMFDRETHRSRGFGFVTFVDPDVSKNILSMGNHSDGVGRLLMRGKTCEVKAAQPKDGGNRGGALGGGKGFRNDRRDAKHFSGFTHHGPSFPGFPPTGPVSFPQPPPGAMMGAPPMHHYPFFPAGPGYMPPIYPHPPSMHYHHPQAQQQQFPHVGYAGAFNPVPPPYPILGQEPMDDGPSFAPAVPLSQLPPYTAALPMMYNMAPTAPMTYPQSSVMQPVAPGIPYKDEEGIKDGVNN